MGRGLWLTHLLLILCSVGAKLIAVDAQSVTISKVTPVGDTVVEGYEVRLRCQATGLIKAGYIIEWTRLVIVEGQTVPIAWNGMSKNSRYTLSTSLVSGAENKIETLIFNATKEDTGVIYGCRARDSADQNNMKGSEQGVHLTVLYFPSARYPICIPDGPVTVQEGTTVNMSCTTELGNPDVQMQILAILTSGDVSEWIYDNDGKEFKMRSLQLNVTAADDGGSYVCKINPADNESETSPFTGMESSCTIGPISFVPMQSEEPATAKESKFAFIIILIPFIVFLIIIFLLIKRRHLKVTKEKETNAVKGDPYMKLQPTEDENRAYMEPNTATTTTQDTYYEPVEETACVRPEGSTNTTYEVVRLPQISAERPYYKNVQY